MGVIHISKRKGEYVMGSFVGTWRLVSFKVRREDGQVVYHPSVGYIMYNEDGYMSVEIMSVDRKRFASEDMGKGTFEEKAEAYSTYFSYCGRYEVNQDKVVHHLEASWYPNYTGEKQERYYTFEGDKLILSTPPYMFAGMKQTAHLTWERVRK